MRSYEVTYIVDSTLENNKIGATAKKYQDMLTENGCQIVAVDEIGLKQLAYPIKRRNSGVYYCVEFQTETPAIIQKAELAMRRDESILRFLTVSLNKFGVKYNADKRDGKIGGKREKVKEEIKEEKGKARQSKKAAPAPKKAAAPAEAPKAKADKSVSAAEATEVKDDLKKIEGIGPKIAEILNGGGIFTFAQLAAATPAAIREMLAAAEGNFASHNPDTWPQQSKMAADGKWDELKKWQDELDGGKVVEAKKEEE